MMLARIGDYFRFGWQVPLFLAVPAFWLIAGPYLMGRALRRHTELPRSQRTLGRCVRVNFLGNGAALLTLAVVGWFFYSVAEATRVRPWVFGAVLLGPVAMALLAWTVNAVALPPLPGGAVRRVTFATVLPLILVVGMLGAGVSVPAWFIRQMGIQQKKAKDQMSWIFICIQRSITAGKEPPDLKTLVADGFLEPEQLRCPGNPGLEVGFWYQPKATTSKEEFPKRIWLCDKFSKDKDYRLVITLGTQQPVDLNEKKFQELLAEEVNKALAERIRAAGR